MLILLWYLLEEDLGPMRCLLGKDLVLWTACLGRRKHPEPWGQTIELFESPGRILGVLVVIRAGRHGARTKGVKAQHWGLGLRHFALLAPGSLLS